VETPWSRARKLRSQQQEERLADLPQGQRQVNSGRFWRWKRDGIVWNFLVEARTTDRGSYSISEKEFQSIKREAITTPPGLKPALQIDVGETSLWLMELRDWEQVYSRLIELEQTLETHLDDST
jgi:hypothetical protein